MAGELANRVTRALDPSADHVALREQASAALRDQLAFELGVWATVDPTTVMWTSCVLDGAERDEAFEQAIFENEFATPDVLKLTTLAHGPIAGTLREATGGDPASSARFRDVLHPRGFADELRVVFHDGTSAWGALHLLRVDRAFEPDEIEAVRDLARPFALALRTSLLRDRAESDPATAPLGTAGAGLILCDADGHVREMSDDARALLGDDRLPPVVQSLIARNRNADGPPATATTVGADGRWLTFQTTALAGMTAVVVERIRPGRMADLIVRSRGLSGRERDVLQQIVLGKANKQIARALGISEWTVQDHVKAVFAKFDVSSRAELVSAVFFEHYVPLHSSSAT